MVSFICQLDCAMSAQIFGQHYSGCLRGKAFLDEIHTWINRLSKAGCLFQCGCASFYPFKGFIGTKKLTFLLIRRNSSCPLDLEHWSYLTFTFELKLLGLEYSGFQTCTLSISFPVSQPWTTLWLSQVSRLLTAVLELSLHNCVSKVLVIILFLSNT